LHRQEGAVIAALGNLRSGQAATPSIEGLETETILPAEDRRLQPTFLPGSNSLGPFDFVLVFALLCHGCPSILGSMARSIYERLSSDYMARADAYVQQLLKGQRRLKAMLYCQV